MAEGIADRCRRDEGPGDCKVRIVGDRLRSRLSVFAHGFQGKPDLEGFWQPGPWGGTMAWPQTWRCLHSRRGTGGDNGRSWIPDVDQPLPGRPWGTASARSKHGRGLRSHMVASPV